jgi:protoporphyrinogen/coproporphyrinogen III oxidase
VSASHSVIVVGAGISGLACAHALRKSGAQVLVLESSPSPGGMIHSIEEGGYLFEAGPQSFSTTAGLNSLINELGLGSVLVAAPPAAPRYILVNGKLHPVPLSPGSFLSSPFLKWSTKFRILGEAFRKTFPPVEDESIAAFVRRKFTPELLELLVGPFVSGIYAGDPEKISLRAAFPALHEAEKISGSIIRGMKAAAKKHTGPRIKPTLTSFRRGNQKLTDALAEKLGDSLRLGTPVSRITKSSEGRFTIATDSEQFESQHLVLAIPASVAAALLQKLAPAAAQALSQIEYAPVAVVSLGFSAGDVSQSLDGFGFLVPRSAGLRVLGTVWNSSLFPGRAADNCVLFTSFLGGATDPEVMSLSESSLVDLVRSELDPLLGLNLGPDISRVTKYEHAIPQYNLGHLDRLAAIQCELAKIPGLHLTGNYLKSPAIGTCIEQAQSVAESIRIG